MGIPLQVVLGDHYKMKQRFHLIHINDLINQILSRIALHRKFGDEAGALALESLLAAYVNPN